MVLTNAEKQSRYRERVLHDQNGLLLTRSRYSLDQARRQTSIPSGNARVDVADSREDCGEAAGRGNRELQSNRKQVEEMNQAGGYPIHPVF